MPPKELPTAETTEKPPKKRSRFKVIMLAVGLLLLFGAGGGAGYWWLYLRPNATGLAGLFGSSETAQQASSTGAASSASGSEASGSSRQTSSSTGNGGSNQQQGNQAARSVQKPVPLPQFTVNLADPPGNRYLKIGMEVEFNTPESAKEVQDQIARVRDAIILLLSSKTVQQLSSAEGKVMLKNEVASRLNQVLGASRVVRVYFTDFVIQ